MRKGIIAFALLLVVALGAGGYVGYYLVSGDIDNESVKFSRTGGYLSNRCVEQDSDLIATLSATDTKWVRKTSRDIIEYRDLMNASEEARRELAAKEAQVREQFLAQQEQVAQEQQELLDRLNQQAVAAILAEGGTELTTADEVTLTPEMAQEILRRRLAGESLEGLVDQVLLDNQVDETNEKPAEGIEASDEYLGQFTAQFYCTAEGIFDESQWRDIKTGDNFIWADPEYIKAGSRVTLSDGSVSVFEVRDGTGHVSGRDITVFNSNAEEYNGNVVMYPRVTLVGG